MKRFNIYKYIAVLAVVLLSSCDKFLDVEPKGVVIPNTLDDYIALMSAPLEVSRSSNNTQYLTDEIQLPAANRAGAAGYPGAAAVKAFDFDAELYDATEVDHDWNVGYRTIYVANTVLVGLESNKENNTAKRNQVKGEALVHRAYTYLTLVNEYAKHYSGTAATDLGVPLNLKPDINVLSARATVKEVYDQIEKDLLEAADILPEKSAFSYRPNKAAAYGVLARMYLYMNNPAKTKEYAGKALAINNFVYDYNTFVLTNPNNPPSSQITNYPAGSINKKHIVLLKYNQKAGGYNFMFLYSDEQFNLFNPNLTTPADVNDLRERFGASGRNYSGVIPNGLKGILENNGIYDYNNGGITTQELILMRAEASARLKEVTAAMTDLNDLRKKRIPTAKYVDLSATTPEEALDFVLRERRIELAFIGLRLADIKRLNVEGRNISIVHDGKTLAPNSPRFVLPIPSKVILLNTNIKQNER